VLLIVALHGSPQLRLVPGVVWCLRAHQALPRAFRKNVKHVILLQPSMLVKAALALLWPFVSSKAHGKVKQVQRLLDIDAATAGEVQVPHLGEHFLTTLAHISSTSSAAQ
jgi:syndecan 1/collagen type V/XI/XXIV/XXVII alpha